MKEEVKQAVAELKELNEKAAAMLAMNQKLDSIFETQKEANAKLGAVIGAMPKPQSKIEKILIIGGNTVAIIGILAAVDIIINWIRS